MFATFDFRPAVVCAPRWPRIGHAIVAASYAGCT
jgi:hypothetical protein